MTMDERHVPTGRVAEMIRWLLEHQEQINAVDRGEVSFSFAGRNLKPQLRVVYGDIHVIEPGDG